ncbi:hypothetical protein GTY54_34560 [Streptomyces sp. SID625]|nr:hypothetical protein [Streptomyces sp. SID625]
MADGENTEREARTEGQDDSRGEQPDPPAEFHMELVDSLPGGRAVMGVEQEGTFTWLADRHHVSRQAREELLDQLTRIVREGWWTQNWHGR